MLGRALCIRHVDAGSCNGCELEIHALNNPYYNLEKLAVIGADGRVDDDQKVAGPSASRRQYDAVLVANGHVGRERRRDSELIDRDRPLP